MGSSSHLSLLKLFEIEFWAECKAVESVSVFESCLIWLRDDFGLMSS